MKFLELHPDYKNYRSEKFYTDQIPRDFVGAFKGYIVGNVHDAAQFRHIIRIIAKHVPCEPGENWNFPWIIDDLDDVIWELYNKKKFHKFMDCIAEIVSYYFKNELEEINELLEDSSIGYSLSFDPFCGAIWEIRESIESKVETVTETIEEIPYTYENTIQHLNQAKEQLSRVEYERARKDALRDCVSALESYLKYISGINDFRGAVKYLQENQPVSKKVIRDALTIWTYVHEEVPEIRHGHTENTDLSEEEVLYWIDRIMALIKYLSRTNIKA